MAASQKASRETYVDPSTPDLIQSLRQASLKSDTNPKPLIRSTVHRLPVTTVDKGKGKADITQEYEITSWKTAEFAYRKAASVGIGKDLPTLARGLFTVRGSDDGERILVRGYDKFFNVGEMGWTKQEAIERYSSPPYELTFKENGCIIFVAALSPSQLVVTSKHSLGQNRPGTEPGPEAGPSAGPEADEVDELHTSTSGTSSAPSSVSHAGKGEEWLDKHLAKAGGKNKADLAAELWSRGQTAVAELCDDTFEEHVLAYPPEKSGLHLHGLNSNSVSFATEPMEEVEKFAKEWGFIPTRYITLGSMQEVKDFTDRVGTTGEWQGEAIEGFVVRTRIPKDAQHANTKQDGIATPPYSPDQVWFYKVKYDEPYLMYRDWRELTKKMITAKTKWEKEGHRSETQSALDGDSVAEAMKALNVDDPIAKVDSNGEKKSKSQLKREQKARQQEAQRRARQGAIAGTATVEPQTPKPDPPKARSNRPETRVFIEWCYDQLYGSKTVRPNPRLFQGINHGKGIIHLRDTFLRYLESPEGRTKLQALGGAKGALAARLNADSGGSGGSDSGVESARLSRPFTHLLVLPIAVPGCGKTSLFLSLRHLFPTLIAHTQSDDVRSKKSGPGFLKSICELLGQSHIVLADRNNHLLKHRDEIVEAVRAWEERGGMTEEEERKLKKQNKHKKTTAGQQSHVSKADDATKTSTTPEEARPRVKIIALEWTLDLLPLNTLHRMMSDRIVTRGSNHQSLIADTIHATGSRSHETILWRFLESLETLGHAEGKGQGDRGRGDTCLDEVIRLNVETSQEEQLKRVCEVILKQIQEMHLPYDGANTISDAQLVAALDTAKRYKVAFTQTVEQQQSNVGKKNNAVRYYGLAVEMDISDIIAKMCDDNDNEVVKGAKAMYTDLQSRGRIISRPHITLVHSSNLPKQSDHPSTEHESHSLDKWKTYSHLCTTSSIDFEIELDSLLYDDKVMCFSVRTISPYSGSGMTSDQFWDLQSETWTPHITIGTVDESVRPFEANRLVSEGKGNGVRVASGGGQKGVVVQGRLRGMY
ncbi:unnamed protein product [Sympodiomycopsis kandeliae]